MRRKKRWMALGLAAMMTTTAAPMPAMAEMEILSSGSEAAAETAAESNAEAADESTAAETLGDGQPDAAANASNPESSDLLIETPDTEGADTASAIVLEPNVEQPSDELASTEALEPTEVGEGETQAPTSGKCGENVTWELSPEGVLTFKGSGDMYARDTEEEDSESQVVRFGAWISYDEMKLCPDLGWSPALVKEVRVESGITNVDYEMFARHENLTKVTLADTVLEMGALVFDRCPNLKEISLPENMFTIGEAAFNECKSLEEIVIPEKVKIIPYLAFSECSSLRTVKLPSGLKEIREGAFEYCVSLKNMEIPDSVGDIGEKAFRGCENLESVRLPKNLVDLSPYAFEKSGLRKVKIPDSVLFIDYSAFSECPKLEKVIFGTGLLKIDDYAFEKCESLKTIQFKGNAPMMSRFLFDRESKEPISAVYPRDDASWTEEVLTGNYGAVINWEMPALPELTAPEVKLSNTNKGVRLSWNPVENAKGYEVYRKLSTDKSYTKIATIEKDSTTSYLDAGTRSGKVYVYAVKAFYNSEHKSAYIRQAIRSLSTPTITRAVRGKTGVSLRWKAVSGAKGYYIYRKAGNGKYVRIGTRNKVGAVTFKDTKAKKGQTYTYAVRAFNGKSMSAFVGKTVK